ncbi:MAG: hypothetical protein AAF384_04345 [Pseudomonadota bacterium]
MQDSPIAAALSVSRFTRLEARRTNFFWLGFAVALGCLLIAEFLASLAITDSSSYRVGFYAAFARLGLVFIVTLFIASNLVREFEHRQIDLIFSRPLSRTWWFLGKLAGLWSSALVVTAIVALPLFFFAPLGNVIAWAITLLAELAIVVAATLTCVITFTNVPLALAAVAAFYLLSRSIESIALMSHGPTVDTSALSSQVIAELVSGLSYVLPGLNHFASVGLLDGPLELSSILILILEALVYAALLAFAGLFDLHRRNL